MRSLHALLRALRTRRNRHHETDPIATTDHPGLADLLDAARAPATQAELAGEKETVAAFVAHRRRAARSSRRHRTKARIRAVLVPVTAGLALLILTATGVAARTGNLPQGAQQHAHRLFSALGVPAPRTGNPVTPSPAPSRSGPRPTLDVAALGWCQAWSGGPSRTLSREDKRKLSAAAGGEKGIEKYCRDLHRSASAQPSAPTTPPSTSPAPSPSTSVEPLPSVSAEPTGTPQPGRPAQPGRPDQPGRAPTAPPSTKPPKPTHTGKPSTKPSKAASPSKSRGQGTSTKQNSSPSPAVTTPQNAARSVPAEDD
ncbi:hypothetical protein OWR29_12145 [Actinoplanes sp. Pm04-4]|uniref:Uncharacterized protein n=1 Tax=Paractinoplanes pyxinae TaxID=2997416 RepID=A0ABT4AX08_9ACTN|nr:hypothetical protein [Actinoplanes pyxinae]MCY1138751.1 hypothetical protein [Actinoplanes pyxinae]